jgi:hypothetical protein
MILDDCTADTPSARTTPRRPFKAVPTLLADAVSGDA